MDQEVNAFEQRYVLFFDFLGASNAAQHWERERIHEFVDLLRAVKQIEAEQEISGEAMDDGGYRLSVVPEITTFSDNVVMTYPGDEDGVLGHVWAEIVLADSIRYQRGIAERALRIGLLIRGGLSYGQCFHGEGVVFGEAMVDAYHLECREADNPRILVSDRIIARVSPEGLPHLLQMDSDGRWHLNYFKSMMQHGVTQGLPGNSESAVRWKAAHRNRIESEIGVLRDNGDELSLHRAKKWEWFHRHFLAGNPGFDE